MAQPSFQERSEELNTIHAALTETTFNDYKAKVLLFLESYPYCYEYWKKLGSATLQYCGMDEALLIYQKAIDTVPYCWQLWASYIEFAKQCGATPTYSHAFTPDVISQLYQLALDEYVGETYMSTTLWRDYLQFSVDQILASNEPDPHAVNTILDTYTYIFTGVSRENPSATGLLLRSSATIFLSLYEQHLNLLTIKIPSLGNINNYLSKAKDDFRQCYDTDTATQMISLYACIEKRPFYHHNPFKSELLARFRTLYKALIDRFTAVNEKGCVSAEIQAILCICCDYADFWLLYIRALVQSQLYNEALDACNMALSRCNNRASETMFSAFYIEKLQILELQQDVTGLNTLTACLSSKFSTDPLIVLALAKHYYRQREYNNCSDIIHKYIKTNCCNSVSVIRSLCRLLNFSTLANHKENPINQSFDKELSKLDSIYTDFLKTSSTIDEEKIVVMEWLNLAQMMREIGDVQYFRCIRDKIYRDYSKNASVLEVVLHTHIQWLQIHGQLTEIIEAEALLLQTAPNNLYSYVDDILQTVSQ